MVSLLDDIPLLVQPLQGIALDRAQLLLKHVFMLNLVSLLQRVLSVDDHPTESFGLLVEFLLVEILLFGDSGSV